MAYWFCSVFNVVCVVNVCPVCACRSELIDSAWVVIVPGQKRRNNKLIIIIKVLCIAAIHRLTKPLNNGIDYIIKAFEIHRPIHFFDVTV